MKKLEKLAAISNAIVAHKTQSGRKELARVADLMRIADLLDQIAGSFRVKCSTSWTRTEDHRRKEET